MIDMTAGSDKSEQLATLTDEELNERLDPPTPAPQPDKVELPATTEAAAPEEDKVEAPKIDLEAENGKLRKQLENLQQIYGKQSNELGELRKQLKDKPTAADFDADPVKAAEQLQERQAQEKEIRELEQAQNLQATAIRNMQFLTQYAPDLSSNAEAIREVLRSEDKLDDGDINKFVGEIFLQNPWGVYQLNQRTKLYNENRKLKAEIEKLKKAPGETINRIKDINKVTSNVKATTGESVERSVAPITDSKQLAGMSDEELQEQLKQLMKGN